jgi:hypothetical protein
MGDHRQNFRASENPVEVRQDEPDVPAAATYAVLAGQVQDVPWEAPWEDDTVEPGLPSRNWPLKEPQAGKHIF